MRILGCYTAVLPKHIMKKYKIDLLKIPIIIDGVPGDYSYEDLVKAFDARRHITTSANTVGEFLSEFKKGKTLFVSPSEKVSAEYNNAVIASRMANATVVNSRNLFGAEGLVLWKAAELKGNVEKLKEYRNHVKIIGVLPTLEALRSSGKANNISAIVASGLRVKLVIEIDKGEISVVKKFLNYEKALNYLLDIVRKEAKDRVFINYSYPPVPLDRVKDELSKNFNNVLVEQVSPVGLAHLGRGVVGIAYEY